MTEKKKAVRGPEQAWRGHLPGRIEYYMDLRKIDSLNKLAELIPCPRDKIRGLGSRKGGGSVAIWQGLARILGAEEWEVRGLPGPPGEGVPDFVVLDPNSMEGSVIPLPKMGLVRVEDDAMGPKYCKGEYCLVSMTDKVEPGDVVAFAHEGRWYVRQFTKTAGVCLFTGTNAGSEILTFKRQPKMLKVRGCYQDGRA